MEHRMSSSLREKIRSDIHNRLTPKWSKVFLKLSIVQFFTSFVVLLFCPQFELGFFPHTFLSHIMMSWGEFSCNLTCGFIFIGAGTISAIIFLTADELRVLHTKVFSSFMLLSTIALSAFMAFGVEFHFIMFSAWFTGAIVSAFMSLEVYMKLSRLSERH